MASKESLCESDAQYLFKALNYSINPIIINCAPLAAEEDAKVGTIQKRISVMAKRYNLAISTTIKGDTNGVLPATPSKPRAFTAKRPGSTRGRKRKAPGPAKKPKEGSDEEQGDEVEVNGNRCEEDENAAKKQKRSNGAAEQEDDGAANAKGGEAGVELA